MGKKEAEKESTLPQVKGTGQLAPLPSQEATVLSRALATDAALREASMSSRPAIVAGISILALFLGGVVMWFVYVPLHSAIHAPAEIVFKSKRQSVQHLEGGIIKRILVHDGDMVQAGQPLIELESSQVRPLVNMLEEQSLADTAYMARLEAESRDQSGITFPRSLLEQSKNPSVARIMQTENRIFAARRDQFQHQVQMLKLQISEIREMIRGTQERLATKKQEIRTIREQLDANQSLQKQGYVTNTVVLDLQRTLAANMGEQEVVAASVASDRQRIAEFEQRLMSLRAERVQGAVNEMKQAAMRRIDAQEKARPLRDTLERQVIRAPVAGKVVGLKVTTIGGVILPREPLMEIAPVGDNLILEAKVRLEDVSDVAVGREADVKISGLNMRTTPMIRAKVTYLSDDRIASNAPGQQSAYYAAILDFDAPSRKFLSTVSLKPGMSATVTIATKPRTPFDYIVDPMQEHLKKALYTR